MTSVAEWLHASVDRLRRTRPSNEAAIEARVLLQHALDRPHAWLLTHPEAALEAALLEALNLRLERLLSGEPLPYLTGVQEFYGLPIGVSPAVLIPRPETEMMVTHALRWLGEHPQRRRAADVGTGSGCIAAALATHCADLRVVAVDRSQDALRQAVRNFAALGVAERVTPLLGNLLSAVSGSFDLICANLPYIPSIAVDYLDVTRHEPRLALDGGRDGLSLIAALLADAPRLLSRGGLMLLEIECGQAESVLPPIRAALPHAAARVLPDLAGLPRMVEILTRES